MQDETKIGVLYVKPSSMEVYVNDKRIALSRTEFDLLSCFVSNSGITLTRDQLLDSVGIRLPGHRQNRRYSYKQVEIKAAGGE
jgi:DNA-binding response OmpR family regulator